MLPRILPGSRGNLGRQEIHNWTVFISRPDCAVPSQETPSGAFFAAKAERAIDQARHKPFETDRYFTELAIQFRDDAVDHPARDQCLPHPCLYRPIRSMREEI